MRQALEDCHWLFLSFISLWIVFLVNCSLIHIRVVALESANRVKIFWPSEGKDYLPGCKLTGYGSTFLLVIPMSGV